MLDLINATSAARTLTPPKIPASSAGKGTKSSQPTIEERLARSGEKARDLYESLNAHLLALGDDVQTKTLRDYFAYRRIKNFACVEVFRERVTVFLKVDPDTVILEDGFTRDVRSVGHFGTGDLEVTLRSTEDIERAAPLLARSYDAS